ncbi:tRNA uridine-5-carboxymethylaminomethyl(34) synthesis enzyme MnmG [Citreicella sp. C3M06]|uniref:tRNA uridine-5-carboxymethylaminomethyl(34) synthesis enzyme MnmG n=1 Tax=Citreicella sp. C3M06 TaxID=2841564 RepID=UPI001C07F761|nr:tRNA uridine-5-carboxymethylaminomethyl(34) synthesis enzyme MnmG [Citreicella sp. C3M06]
MKHRDFDVVVVGGGHAGAEAAAASARFGARTALITLTLDGIGVMSCNPAIGGLGKGHLVREIDAMDGVMGRIADRAGIQFRLLNRRKGPAVQGPRAQADRGIYRKAMQSELADTQNLTIVKGEVVDLLSVDGKVGGVTLADGSEIATPTVVLTTGTFLRGVIHIGDQKRPGGRMGDQPSVRLAQRIDSLGLELGRLKTGTPPRLDGRTINWSILDEQPGDDEPVLFSFLSKAPVVRQVSCGITHTNSKTHDIIRENLHQSAMYGGHIEGVGPRYCPSIEDKVVRFSDKDSHQIFLEPEGLDDHTIYPNGISTSLPIDVQLSYVRSISGLENVEITQPGYAIEYDFVDPRSLDLRLGVRNLPGLFLAGQINGTTGYEEAAAQGLVAGLNAAQEARGLEPVLFGRADSYIGVMVDDLTTRGVVEPYRMFTSRAEFRLSLRADNADQRLTPRAIALGCVSERRKSLFERKQRQLDAGKKLLNERSFSSREIVAMGIPASADGQRRTGYQLLSFPDVTIDSLKKAEDSFSEIDQPIAEQLQKDALYANYIQRQERDVAALRRDEALEIPVDFNFDLVEGLSHELKQKLSRARPKNLSQAGKVDGITPAALSLLLLRIRRFSEVRSA